MLGSAGFLTTTEEGEEAARLLSFLTWSHITWHTQKKRIAWWLQICDEDMRSPLPAEEEGVLAYIWYLSLEEKIAPKSLSHYHLAVLQYKELHYLESRTKTL